MSATKCPNGHVCQECENKADQKRAEIVNGIKAGIFDALIVPAIVIFVAVVVWVIGW